MGKMRALPLLFEDRVPKLTASSCQSEAVEFQLHSAQETESPDAPVEVVSQQRGDQWPVSLSGRITIDAPPNKTP
jgi:hypothetical protein